MTATSAASRLGYRPELDGLRGVAVILVVLLHLRGWPPGGFLGVDVFFTLSGFLITTLLFEEWRANDRVSLRDFYVRRSLRLFPAVIVLLVFYTVVSLILGGPELATRLKGALYGATYVSNWIQAYGLAFPEKEIGYLWSLAIEEQFYLLWPAALLLAVSVVRLSPRRLIGVLTLLIVAVVAWRYALTSAGVVGRRVYFGTDGHLDQLMMGAALAIWFVARPMEKANLLLIKLAGWAGVAFLAWRLFDPEYFRWWYPTIGLAATGLASTAIIGCLVTNASPILKAVLSTRWLRVVGVLSYSLYLWHVPAIRLVERSPLSQSRTLFTIGGVVLSLLFAGASYQFVERPFLRRRRAHERLRATKADAEATASGVGRAPFLPQRSELMSRAGQTP